MDTILVIEDDDAMRKQTTQVLNLEGFEVLEAVNGKLGVAAAIQCVPSLIVCDIMMPDLDGLGVLTALREHPRTALIPFIFLTAKGTQPDLRAGMDEGADDYLTKPYKIDTLLGSVHRRLAKNQRRIEEGRRDADAVSLGVAVSVPQAVLEALDHIMSVTNRLASKHAGQDSESILMHEVVAKETVRLRHAMRRLHLFAQLPQLYADRLEVEIPDPLFSAGEVIDEVAGSVCLGWDRTSDLAIVPDPAAIPFREDYLAVVTEELIDNACKFSAPGTPIEVARRRGPRGWSLSVTNRGVGMSAEEIASVRAFKQFWRGGKKPPGLGLGLALTQGIARLHGCELSLAATEQAFTATFLVPLEE